MRELERAEQIIAQSICKKEKEFEDISFSDYILTQITENLCDTIKIKKESSTVIISSKFSSKNQIARFKDISNVEYEQFCLNNLNINSHEKFNCSRTEIIDGVRVRIFAMMPPFVKSPDITISTTKSPPSSFLGVSDELLNNIVHSNFIIAGASGSGKTFLLNFLLNKYIKEEESIALIQEFGELIPPNELTTSLVVPPPKPNEKHMLKFVTEQSNLMRLQSIYVGEIKGDEAWPFIVNLASGTKGGATIHGHSAKKALARLRALCFFSCDNSNLIDEFISKTIEYVILMDDKKLNGIWKLLGSHHQGVYALDRII